jgi:tetratricopeptide (TPR) repeat protein
MIKPFSKIALTAICCFLWTLSSIAQNASSPNAAAFVDVNVIPINSDGILKNQTVIVRNSKIAEIGHVDKIRVPEDALRIDGRGKYLIPGLTDMHVHIQSPDDLYLWMANGITTVLNLNGRPQHLRWRKEIEDGNMEGPTLYTSGPTIYIANTAREGDSLTETYHTAGYDCLKIYNDVTTEAYDTIIKKAKKYHMLTVGHIPRQPGFYRVLDAGMAIAHAEEYMYTILADSVDEGKIPDLVGATHLAGITLIATLTAYDHITRQVGNLDSILAQPDLKYIEPWIREEWAPEKNKYSKKRGFKLARLEFRLEFQKKMIAAMHKAGVRVLVGTDGVFNCMVSGDAALEEIENFVSIGFTPSEALKAASLDAAEFLRKPGEFGSIEKGKRADLVLLDANPLDNISNIRKQSGVMLHGRWYTHEGLRAKLDLLPRRFDEQERAFKDNLQHDFASAMAFETKYDPFNLLLNRELTAVAHSEKPDYLKSLLQKIHSAAPDADAIQELPVNDFGYTLLADRLFKPAIAVLTFNAEAHPTSANVFDSLAEAYLDDGDKEMAIKYYKKALEVDPNLISSINALKKLK